VSLYSVCIATYRRPIGLERLLQSIEDQVIVDDSEVEIIVVDNDPGSAKDVVSRFAANSRFPVHYLIQSEPNISITRNLAVASARGEFIWFIDDDEVASRTCLARLSDALVTYDADGVFGPVLPQFEDGTADWIRRSSAFNRPIGVTGTRSFGYRTSNTLVRTDVLLTQDGPFDPAFGITGGSDSMLFRLLAKEGRFFIDSSDAFVTEDVPPDRANWEWMRNRIRRQGQNYGRQVVVLAGSAFSPSVVWMLSKALLQIARTFVLSVLNWRDQNQRSEWLLRLWSNVGKFEGVRGTTSVRAP
jgi:succinoglycan biosynthesis protein ExoM